MGQDQMNSITTTDGSKVYNERQRKFDVCTLANSEDP